MMTQAFFGELLATYLITFACYGAHVHGDELALSIAIIICRTARCLTPILRGVLPSFT
jgi:hypothetical protein